MSRSFTIPYDMSRYSRFVTESGSYIATVPNGEENALLGTILVEGVRYMASIPTDNYQVEYYYPVVEQQNAVVTIKNSFLPYTVTIGKKD